MNPNNYLDSLSQLLRKDTPLSLQEQRQVNEWSGHLQAFISRLVSNHPFIRQVIVTLTDGPQKREDIASDCLTQILEELKKNDQVATRSKPGSWISTIVYNHISKITAGYDKNRKWINFSDAFNTAWTSLSLGPALYINQPSCTKTIILSEQEVAGHIRVIMENDTVTLTVKPLTDLFMRLTTLQDGLIHKNILKQALESGFLITPRLVSSSDFMSDSEDSDTWIDQVEGNLWSQEPVTHFLKNNIPVLTTEFFDRYLSEAPDEPLQNFRHLVFYGYFGYHLKPKDLIQLIQSVPESIRFNKDRDEYSAAYFTYHTKPRQFDFGQETVVPTDDMNSVDWYYSTLMHHADSIADSSMGSSDRDDLFFELLLHSSDHIRTDFRPEFISPEVEKWMEGIKQ